MSTNEEIVVALRRAARDLTAKRSIRDLDQTLTDIVRAAVDAIPQVDAGGISITEDAQVASRNATGEAITKLDQLQSQLHEGPCITALAEPPEDGIVVAQDLAGADGGRWPEFVPHVLEAGYRSMMSTELSTGPGMRAALNLYATEAQVFDTEARLTAGLFGIQAAMLLYGSDHARHLQRALESRDLIGQAKGILMERFGVDDDGAFQLMVKSSQETNLKLADVARWLRDQTAERNHHGAAGAEPGGPDPEAP